MNIKWLSLFILVSLLLILGGVRHSAARPAAEDPVQHAAESSVADAAQGPHESWQDAARQNPQWLIEIAAQ